MRKSMTAAALTAVVVLAAATGAGAANAPSQSYQVAGLATVSPQGTTTSLAGFGTGSTGDRAFWRASITTAPLASCSSLGSSCAITGGTFGLNSNNGSQVTGTITGGSVTLTAQAPGCGRQQFTVNGGATTNAGDVAFTVVLTQFRLSFRGTCIVLPGSALAGSVTVGGQGGLPA
jgi:hypothetical protein